MSRSNNLSHAIEGHRQWALELLQDLVRIPSLEGEEKPCQELIATKLKELGLNVDVWVPSGDELASHKAYVPSQFGYEDRPNVVGKLSGQGNGRSLILSGHVDVVPTLSLIHI